MRGFPNMRISGIPTDSRHGQPAQYPRDAFSEPHSGIIIHSSLLYCISTCSEYLSLTTQVPRPVPRSPVTATPAAHRQEPDVQRPQHPEQQPAAAAAAQGGPGGRPPGLDDGEHALREALPRPGADEAAARNRAHQLVFLHSRQFSHHLSHSDQGQNTGMYSSSQGRARTSDQS